MGLFRRLPFLPFLLLLTGCVGSFPMAHPAPGGASGAAGPALEALLQLEAGEGPGIRLVRLAQAQLGRPYRYGGVGPEGFDCSGLVFHVHREAGIPVPRSSGAQHAASRPLPASALEPGDLVFFNISGRKVSHVGLYVADGLFIHAPASGRGVSYASLADSYWRERLAGAGRFH